MASSPEPASAVVRVAVDSGGTFTDVIGVLGEDVAVAKVASTPDDPARAVLDGARRVVAELGAERWTLVHGTTVATNALLEGRGAETWFVTQEGLEDLLAIGRQHRDQLYALEPAPRPNLVPRERCVGVAGRIGPRGERIAPLDTSALRARLAALDDAARSWAVCLLHAYADASDEEAVGAAIRELRPHDDVSLSARILPEFREVERASTTVANAFVQPVMRRYLGRLSGTAERVEIMASSGGRLALDEAMERPVLTALSGPAGGVVAALEVSRRLGVDAVVSFDMGGTSTDVALCSGGLPLSFSGRVGSHAIHTPMLDIHTIGAGGGSIARVDAAGALRVGPESAGADPGPACYGRGRDATVTDANVVLGRLPADARLGGHMAIDAARAREAVGRVASEIGATVDETARGIVRIAVEKMAQAIRRVSTERGVDARSLPLVTFGGAGGLHACELAEELGMSQVVVPGRAGLLSALGMLVGSRVAERSRTVLGMQAQEVAAIAAALRDDARAALGEEPARMETSAALRYAGQSFELTVPFDGGHAAAEAAFEARHELRFGYRLDATIEWVTVRTRAESAPPPRVPDEAPQIEGELRGPASLVDLSSTTWIAPGWTAAALVGGGVRLMRSRE